MSRVIGNVMLVWGHVQDPSDHHCRCCGGTFPSEVAAAYGVSKGWVSKLVARYRTEGEAAFEPRSRRPRSSPNKTPSEIVDLIVGLREQLTTQGLDAGPETICWHLETHHQIRLAAATVWRHLKARGLIEAQPTEPQPQPRLPTPKQTKPLNPQVQRFPMSRDITPCPRQESNLRHPV